jgi:hypothetical protein
MPTTTRHKALDPDDPGAAGIEPGNPAPWWAPLREWPSGMRFEDVPIAVLTAERQHDRPLPRLEVPIACSARLRVEAPFAGLGVDLEGARPLRATIMRRVHPFDRCARALQVTA